MRHTQNRRAARVEQSYGMKWAASQPSDCSTTKTKYKEEMTKTINGESDLTKYENKTQKKTDKQQIGYAQKPEVSELQGVVCTRPPESDSGVRKEELLPMSVSVHKGWEARLPMGECARAIYVG